MDIFNLKTINEVCQLLKDNKQTVAVAESCTAGLIQNAFSQANEAMTIFQGGMTVYNLGQKAKHLHVNPIFAQASDSVSNEVAEKMALEVAAAFNAEIGLAITGYAQPSKTIGITECFAYIAIAQEAEIVLSKRVSGDEEKSLFENQCIFTKKVIEELLTFLQPHSKA